MVSRHSRVQFCIFSFFGGLIIIRSGLLAWIRLAVCKLKSHRSLCVAFSRTGYRPSRVSPFTPAVLICCISLLYDWWFHLCHHIACYLLFCYFVEPYLFSLWYDWFLWRCLVLLSGGILFLCLKFPFLCHVQVLSCGILFISRLNLP